MGIGYFGLSADLLACALGLPEGARIHGVSDHRFAPGLADDVLCVEVSHPDIPNVLDRGLDDHVILSPVLSRVEKSPGVAFEGWGKVEPVRIIERRE